MSARRSAPARTRSRHARSTVERFFAVSASSIKIVARRAPPSSLSTRVPQCRHTRGDEITNTVPSCRMRDAMRGNSRSTPRPHSTSYFPFAARTEIFFIRFLRWRFWVEPYADSKKCNTDAGPPWDTKTVPAGTLAPGFYFRMVIAYSDLALFSGSHGGFGKREDNTPGTQWTCCFTNRAGLHGHVRHVWPLG